MAPCWASRSADRPATISSSRTSAPAIARRWYDSEQVDLIVDVPVSAVGLAVQNVANEKKKMFITHSTGTADFHGKFCSPYAIQWVFDTRALAVGTAQEVVKRGGDSWFFLTDDYAFGHSLERDASAVSSRTAARWSARCGRLSPRPIFPRSSCRRRLRKRRSSASPAGPPNNINEIKTGGEFGVFKGGQQMAGLLALITDIHALGPARCPGAVADDVVLLGHGRQDAGMVEALFRQDEPDADDVAGRRLFLGHDYLRRSRQPAPTSRSRSRRRCARSRSRISSPATANCARTI